MFSAWSGRSLALAVRTSVPPARTPRHGCWLKAPWFEGEFYIGTGGVRGGWVGVEGGGGEGLGPIGSCDWRAIEIATGPRYGAEPPLKCARCSDDMAS